MASEFGGVRNMKCEVCSKGIRPDEGFMANVNRDGKALAEGEEPVIVCGKDCMQAFESSLKFKGKPLYHLSRITGYVQHVENWNEAKKKEFFDRQRYSV